MDEFDILLLTYITKCVAQTNHKKKKKKYIDYFMYKILVFSKLEQDMYTMTPLRALVKQ